MCWQLGLLPKLDREVQGLFTASERVLQDFAQEKKLNATFVKDHIQKALHHPDFDPKGVDHDMHERLMGTIEEGDPAEEYRTQDVRLFKRPGKVSREFLPIQGWLVVSTLHSRSTRTLQRVQGHLVQFGGSVSYTEECPRPKARCNPFTLDGPRF